MDQNKMSQNAVEQSMADQNTNRDQGMTEGKTVLCAANSYEQKYYLNPAFEKLPEGIRQELKILCVLFTEDIGGVIALEFNEKGRLEIQVTADEQDYLFDEIGSELKIRQYQREKRELLRDLELFYQVFVLKKDPSLFLEDEDGEELYSDGEESEDEDEDLGSHRTAYEGRPE